MLIHDLKILYLHPAKTGGTSIEYAFLEFIYKRFITENELSVDDKYKIHCYNYGKENASQHHTFEAIKTKFPYIDSWTVVISARNPYDRIISEFKYQLDGYGDNLIMNNSIAHKNKDINLAIKDNSLYECSVGLHKLSLSDYYVPNAYILKLENLNTDWNDFQKKLNIKLPEIKHFNKSSNYNFILNDTSKKLIYDKFEQDFKLFNYIP